MQLHLPMSKVSSQTHVTTKNASTSSRCRPHEPDQPIDTAHCSVQLIDKKKSKELAYSSANNLPSARPKRRSFTRSPTPIKYNYNIYQKRSPTFGRRCPVLNRKRRASTPRQSNADDAQDPTISINSSINLQDQEKPQQSSRLFQDRRLKKATKFVAKSSYFQHDNRNFDKTGPSYRSTKSFTKKRRWKSPARWQHDLYDGHPESIKDKDST